MSWGIRQESTKHKAERTERQRITRFVRQRDRGCRARELVPEVRCDGPLDVHERIPRSAWRAGYLEAQNCLLVCRAHHDWIDQQPDMAHDLGLHGYSWEVPG